MENGFMLKMILISMLDKCWATVIDGGTTIIQHWMSNNVFLVLFS